MVWVVRAGLTIGYFWFQYGVSYFQSICDAQCVAAVNAACNNGGCF